MKIPPAVKSHDREREECRIGVRRRMSPGSIGEKSSSCGRMTGMCFVQSVFIEFVAGHVSDRTPAHASHGLCVSCSDGMNVGVCDFQIHFQSLFGISTVKPS